MQAVLLPREFTAITVVIYIAPSVNVNEGMSALYSPISEQKTAHLNVFFIVARDFSHAKLKTVVKEEVRKFYQQGGIVCWA